MSARIPARVQATVPVFNEAAQLGPSIVRLHGFLDRRLPYGWEIVIANNGSTDGTWRVAEELVRQYDRVRLVQVSEPGRGRALKQVWTHSDAEVVSYMDVDLSTQLEAYPKLIRALLVHNYDVAVGSRLLPASQVRRGLKREIISRGYNLLVKALFFTRFTDAQCGFKALTRRAAAQLLPLVEDPAWFFDTELLIRAHQLRLRIFDLPVHWVDDSDSRVKIIPTALADLKGLARLRFGPAWRGLLSPRR